MYLNHEILMLIYNILSTRNSQLNHGNKLIWLHNIFKHIIFDFLRSFPGHLNDATTYRYLPSIGFHGQKQLPRNARLLADGGYAGRVPLITPHRIARNRIQRRANRELRKLRVQIEHRFGDLKVYNSISQVFRQKRAFLPFVVGTCGCFVNRRRLFIQRLRRR